MTAAAVARHFGVSRSTISRLQDRLVSTGSVADSLGGVLEDRALPPQLKIVGCVPFI